MGPERNVLTSSLAVRKGLKEISVRLASRPFLQISLCTALIFVLSLKLHGSKLMLKLYYMCEPTSLLTGCDTNVALDSGLSLGE